MAVFGCLTIAHTALSTYLLAANMGKDSQCKLLPTHVSIGLFVTYWGSKLTALRRAQKPSALGDEVTKAINLLVRLLPLVQMILMFRLYFPVSNVKHSSPGGSAVTQLFSDVDHTA